MSMSLGMWVFGTVAVLLSIAVGEQIAALSRGATWTVIARRNGGVVTGLGRVLITRLSGPFMLLWIGGAALHLGITGDAVWLIWPGMGLLSLGYVILYATVRWFYRELTGGHRTPVQAPDEEAPF